MKVMATEGNPSYKMKTAEEWIKEAVEIGSDLTADQYEKWQIEFTKQIQLDAWKQGMTDAAKICESKDTLTADFQWSQCCYNLCDAIEEERDNKQSL